MYNGISSTGGVVVEGTLVDTGVVFKVCVTDELTLDGAVGTVLAVFKVGVMDELTLDGVLKLVDMNELK